MNENRHNKVDYIEFASKDLEATKAFYTKVFGWRFTDYGDDYTCFEDGRIAGGFAKGKVQTGSVLVVIHVNDLAATYDRVKKAGGWITKETFSFPGGSRFHYKDPGGNELAVWHEG